MQPENPVGSGWRRVVANPEIGLAMLILVVLAGISGLQVVMRYIFNAPLPWTEEISGMALVWMTFLGAVGLARRNLHARVELLVEVASDKRWFLALDLLLDLLGIAFLILVVIGGWDLIQQLDHEKTPALRLPVTWQVAAIPLSALAMAIVMSARAIGRLMILGGRRPS